MIEVVTGTVFFQVICDAVFISSTFFQMELVKTTTFSCDIEQITRKMFFLQTFKNIDIKFVMSIFASVVGIGSILPYCYYASKITAKMDQLATTAFQSRWYDLPLSLQRNIHFIILFAQIKRTVNGYKLFRCDLEGFVKVSSLLVYL